jgi:hypothetical protein
VTTGPTFVAKFADGEVTRMTVWAENKPNLSRGVRLARHAYRSRTGNEPPPIIEARFERDGSVLETYDAKLLEAVP